MKCGGEGACALMWEIFRRLWVTCQRVKGIFSYFFLGREKRLVRLCLCVCVLHYESGETEPRFNALAHDEELGEEEACV
jgi:hypothetical protein